MFSRILEHGCGSIVPENIEIKRNIDTKWVNQPMTSQEFKGYSPNNKYELYLTNLSESSIPPEIIRKP